MVFFAGETLTAQDLNDMLLGMAPVGAIMMWPTTTPPSGWLICNGSGFSAVDYPALNTILGGAVLPDMRDRFPVGTSGTKAVKSTGGSATSSLTTANLASHGHSISGASQSHSVVHDHALSSIQKTGISNPPQAILSNGDNAGSSVGQGATGGRYNASITGTTANGSSPHTHNPGTYVADANGSGTPFSVQNPYLSLNFIIRAG